VTEGHSALSGEGCGDEGHREVRQTERPERLVPTEREEFTSRMGSPCELEYWQSVDLAPRPR